MDASMQSRAELLADEFAQSATTIEEFGQLLRLMMKSGLERVLDAEMDVRLGRRGAPAASPPAVDDAAQDEPTKRSPNRRNGRSKKTVQGDLGAVTIATPRDRDGTFEPQIIEKHQRRIPDTTREDPRPVRQGDGHARHPGRRPSVVRRGGLGDADLRNHGRSRR